VTTLKTAITPLIRFSDNVLIKDESKNPFGTYKDRLSEKVIKEALKKRVSKIILITSGNAGYSLAKYADGAGIKIICVIDKKDSNSVKSSLRSLSKVIEVDLMRKIYTQDEILELVKEKANETIWNGIDNFYKVYADIVKEIKQEKPDYMVVPVGSGDAFMGIYEGIKEYGLRTKLIGVGVKKGYRSYADKLWSIWIPSDEKIKKIVNNGNEYYELSEEEIKSLYQKYKNKFEVEPSSSVVFGVFLRKQFLKSDKIILINSGKGIF
jgi:threonine synthase